MEEYMFNSKNWVDNTSDNNYWIPITYPIYYPIYISCPYCGLLVESGDRYCKHCSKQLIQDEYCSKCGQKLKKEV